MPLAEMGEPKPETEISLADFVVWVKETSPFVGVELPQQFLELEPPALPKVRRATPGAASEPSAAGTADSTQVGEPRTAAPTRNEKAAATNRENKLLLTLLGLAISHYEYDIEKSKKRGGMRDVYERIAADVSAVGLPTTAETVKAQLEAGAEVASSKGLTIS